MKLITALVVASPIALLLACSGSGGGSTDTGTSSGFQLTKISVLNDSIWEINRPIELTFNQAVDFTTVSFNSINIQTQGGMPASGAFFLKGLDADQDGVVETVDPRVVVFQPTCPTLDDLSDAGLQPGGVDYVLSVPGRTSGGVNTVHSATGKELRDSQTRFFTTPSSNDPRDVYLDPLLGAPDPVVRAVGSVEENASHIEYGVAGGRVYFEFDAASQTHVLSEAGFEAPLNLYRDPATRVAVMLYFNQPVDPSSENINPSRLTLQFADPEGEWQPLDTRVELVSNCSGTGALVRLEPRGILPAMSRFRVKVGEAFSDLVGETNHLALVDFGEAPTATVHYGSLTPPDDEADEIHEGFAIGGDLPGSLEDAEALFDAPKAVWKEDRLVMAYNFEGSGGPGGNFDWVIRAGQTFVFDTSFTSIVGGPGGLPTTTQNTADGFVEVRDLIVEAGAYLRVQGPNPMTVSATGTVRIDGTIDVSGFNAKDVSSLNTGSQPEVGGAGAASGGKGGTASWVTNNSTPRGGTGWGPDNLLNGGGIGGESGYEPTDKQLRRPGGGGGGTLHAPVFHYPLNLLLEAQAGHNGAALSTGAQSNQSPAAGGFPGAGPFLDGDPTNDFLGVLPLDDGTFVRGELTHISAGAGGGAGGDALPSSMFPTPNWNIGSDEKGGGGGGGAGGLNIRALGPITFGNEGTLVCDGGRGATGENVINKDHIGGTGGSGSGGHVILETASHIAFGDGAGAPDRFYITAMGGPGVVGNTQWMTGPDGTYPSNGGPGGPGLIQIHVPRPLLPPSTSAAASDIVMSLVAASDDHPLEKVAAPGALAMVPVFGATSKARSKWISVGGAAQDPVTGVGPISFRFGGTDPADGGRVLSSGDRVEELAPLLAGDVTGSDTVAVREGGAALELSGTALDPLIQGDPFDDLYLRTPLLLKNFLLRLAAVEDPATEQDFEVTWGDYDDAAVALTLTVDTGHGTLAAFLADAAGLTVRYELIPRFFRVATGDVPDALPDTARVMITFDATGADQFGNPVDDPAQFLIEKTTDLSDFNALEPGALRFFRFHVEFGLDTMDADTEPLSLDFLRIPFRF